MTTNLAVLVTAAGCALAAAAAIGLLLKTGMGARWANDRPNERSLHMRSIPRFGGIVVIVVAGAFVFAFVPSFRTVFAIVVPLTVVSAVDDRCNLPAGSRLILHIAAAAFAGWLLFRDAPLWALLLITLAIAWAANLYNFMDGSDGMAGGMALFGFGTYACVAAADQAWGSALVAASIAGAAAGFLLFNLPPARVFLGDAGSVPLGFLAAIIGLIGWRSGRWSLVFPLLVFSPFVIDATATLLARAFRRERLWQAHRSHLYQRMILGGMSHQRTALIWYVAMSLAAVGASWSINWAIEAQIGLLGAAAALYAIAFLTVRARAPAERLSQ